VSGWRLLALTTASTAVLAASLFAQPAFADGDPASDVLVGQDVFLPLGQTTTSKQVAQLTTLAREADRAGNPLKIALIAAPTDLGSVSALYGQPDKYARFLSLELEFVTKAPVLIVMAQGIGFARAGKTIPSNRLIGLRVPSGPEGLVQTAITAINRLEPHLKPAPATPPPRVPIRPPANHASVSRQAPSANQSGNAITGTGRPSDSLGQVIADRFATGARDPVVWAALGITLAIVGLAAAGVYLTVEWTMRRGPRR
jgi:hypothetical protein